MLLTEVEQMNRNTLLVLMLLLASLTTVSADEMNPIAESATGDNQADADLSANGIKVLAWRNDTFDADEDGRLDAVRIVLALNITEAVETSDINILVEAFHDGRSIELWANHSLNGAIETSIQVDAWGEGIYLLKLQMYDPQSGSLLADLDAGEWNMAPALATPSLKFDLKSPGWIETGDHCEIKRVFVDEIGERYGKMGQRDLRGTPFATYEWDTELDCSTWPAGEYTLHETYQNGLGQSTEAWLNLTINNRPPPAIKLVVIGDGEEYGGTCLLVISAETLDSTENWNYTWDTIPDHAIGDVSEINCGSWQPGVHMVRVEIKNAQGISTTVGINLIRLTPIGVVDSNISENQSMAWPVRSGGDMNDESEGGLYGVGSAALLIFLVCVIIGMRSKELEEDDVMETPVAMQNQMLTPAAAYQQQWGQTEEDPVVVSLEELPTTVDADGITWRRHPDGRMDWFDEGSSEWHAFE